LNITGSYPNLINGVSQQPDAARMPDQCREMVNAVPSLIDGLHKRPPTNHIARLSASSLAGAAIHTINRDATEKYIVALLDTDLKVYGIDGAPKTVAFPDGKSYLDVTGAPQDTLRAFTVDDVTFIANREKTVAMDAALTPTLGYEALIWVQQGLAKTKYQVTLNATVAEYITATNEDTYAATRIASEIYDDLNAALSATFDFQLEGNVIYVHKKDNGDFTITPKDEGNNAALKVVKGSVQRSSDLPTIAYPGLKVKVYGSIDSGSDDFWVEFIPDNAATMGRGSWVETVAPGIKYKFDASTVPHVLVRESNGTFTFRKANTGVAVWGNRVVGDAETAPEPSFVGRKITDIFLYGDRLGFLSDENVILSRTSQYFSFWRETVTTVTDDSPIDLAAVSTSVESLHAAIPFSGRLVLFSQSAQWHLYGGDVLSPKTAAVKMTTRFAADSRCRPVPSGTNIIFPTSRGQFSGIREYFVAQAEESFDASESTKHVSSYIPSRVTQLACSANEETLFVRSSGNTKALYVYRWYWSGEQKVQSAWGKWTFDGDVLAAAFLDETLYVISQRADGAFLESLNLESGRKDSFSDFVTCLDRRTYVPFSGAVYEDGSTHFTVPYVAPDNVVVVTASQNPDSPDNEDEIAGVVLEVEDVEDLENGTSIVSVKGNHLGPAWVGIDYEMRYSFSPPPLKADSLGGSSRSTVNDAPIRVGTLQLRFEKTALFRAEVWVPGVSDPFVQHYAGRWIGHDQTVVAAVPIASGVLNIPVRTLAEDFRVELVNDSFGPSHFISCDWTGSYTQRNRRV